MKKELTYRKAINEALRNILKVNKNMVLIGEDVCDPYGGAFKVTKGLSAKYPERVINMPISESTFVGFAAGLCVKGMKAIVEIMFSDFIYLCMDQICNHASKFNMMYGLDEKVFSIVIRMPSGGGRGYGPTHSQSPENILLGLPGVNVFAPTRYHNIESLYVRITHDMDVNIIVESKIDYPETAMPLPYVQGANGYGYAMYENSEYSCSPDVTILAYGQMASHAILAAERIEDEKVGVKILIPDKISTLDYAPIVQSVLDTKRLVIVEEGYKKNGWGQSIAGYFAEEHSDMFPIAIRVVGVGQTVIPSNHDKERSIIHHDGSILNIIRGVVDE